MFSRLHRNEKGVALIVVMILGMVGLGFVTAVMSYSTGSMSISRRDQDWGAALSAAEAGVDDYLYRLNRDGNYWQYSSSTPPPDGNQAFSQSVAVPGPSNQGNFTYAPDASTISGDGAIKLTVTGKVRGVERSIYVTLRRRNFLDYLYFTDYETKDPAAYVKPPDVFTPAEAQVNCALHYYEGRNASCVRIFFVGLDVINGPLHSNDAINISGNPQFRGDTSTSWDDPSGRRWLGTGSPIFANPGDPAFFPPLSLPPTNSSIKSETDALLGGAGCLYTGPTLITLGNGTMTVNSPFTKASNCAKTGTVPLPANGVIFTQNVPSDPSDPNYTNGCPHAVNNGYRYPSGFPVPISGDLTTYGCRDGDVFVSGTLNGQLSIAAEHNIVVVNHTRYAGGTSGDDLLGLIANNYVEVFHPVDCSSATSSCDLNRKAAQGGSRFTDAIIQAAILSVQHSFIVQRYAAGTPLGNLNVTGAIGQRYRGPVGTFSGTTIVSGYRKNYAYDTRLAYLSPPHFLDPVQSSWQTVTWAETSGQ